MYVCIHVYSYRAPSSKHPACIAILTLTRQTNAMQCDHCLIHCSVHPSIHPSMIHNRMTISSMNDIHEKIKNIRPLYSLPNILLLQRPSLIILAITPAPQGQFQNEHFTSFRKQNRCLGRNHPHVLIALHDTFDPRQGQIVVILKILFGLGRDGSQIFHLMELVRPECVECITEFFEKGW